MHVLIPAGGRGVRLRPITNYSPKPLLPLGDRPILNWILESIPTDFPVTLMVSADVETDFRAWQAQQTGPRRVQVYCERPRPLEQRGPVVALADCLEELAIQDDVLIMMGDSVLPFTVSDFFGGADLNHARLAAYQLPSRGDASRFGVLEIGSKERVASFEEKPAEPRSSWVFTGCLHIPRRMLPTISDVAAAGAPQMGHLVSGFLSRGEVVDVFRVHGEWHDIGTFASYLAAHERLTSETRRQALYSTGNSVEGVVYVHPEADVRGCTLRNSLIFAGTRITDAALDGCIVRPEVELSRRSAEKLLFSVEGEYPLV
jgi:glucose-1-phosphate thymidylyltransferase